MASGVSAENIKDPIYRRWNKTSIECYLRGCICEGCPIKKIIESKCRMKKTVLLLVQNIGAPEGVHRQDIIEDK